MFQRVAFLSSILGIAMLSTAATGADEPQWLREARAREAKSLKPAEFKSKDGWFKAKAPGKVSGAIEKVEGSYSVEIDIGSEAAVQCEVYPEGIDLANALRVTALGAFEAIGESYGKVEGRVLEASDAGAHGPVPFIALTWLYRVSTPEGAKLGSLKQFVMEKGDQGVYCAHNELGYTRTFGEITRAFADSLQVRDAAPAPYFTEIHSATIGGVKVGVAVGTLIRDADGDSRARHVTSVIMATNDGSLQTQDSSHIEWVQPDGSLINVLDTEVSNGDLVSSLALKQADDGWLVEGEIQGKAVQTLLPQDSKPTSWLSQVRELRAMLEKPDPLGQEQIVDMWIDQDPGQLSIVKTKILANKDAKHVTALADIGEIKADMVIEKTTGLPSAVAMHMGPIDLLLERAYVDGGF